MKKFKEFINENIRDILQPKPEESILNELDKLSDNDKIHKIIKYQLDFDLLPRNEEGICVYDGNLECDNNRLTSLPDNLTINGHLYCDNNRLTSFPDNLKVKQSIFYSFNRLKYLPDNLTVNGHLCCDNNKLIILPKGLKIYGDLDCKNNKVKLKLPNDAIVKGNFIN